MFDQESLKNSSLSGLGAMLLDAMDEGVMNGEPEQIENACAEIGNEVIFRVPDAEKLRHMMDFHYKKWADMLTKDNVSDEQKGNAYLELRAMMTGYVQVHCPSELGSDYDIDEEIDD